LKAVIHGIRAEILVNNHKFLDLWNDADPGLPEVDVAKKRLDGLKNR
jgi:hypothetical protein